MITYIDPKVGDPKNPNTNFLTSRTKTPLLGIFPIIYFYYFIRLVFNTSYETPLDIVNFLIHEGGHMFFIHFGQYAHILGGTIFEIAVPLIILVYFYLCKYYMGSSFCLFWLGTVFFDIGVYASDAQKTSLELFVIGNYQTAIHDWNYLLTKWDILHHTTAIGNTFYFLGGFFIFAALYLSVKYIIYVYSQ